MKRKFFTLLAASLFTVSLGGCNQNSGTVEPPKPPTSAEVVANVFSHFSRNSLGLRGTMTSKSVYGQGEEMQEYDNGSFAIEAALGDGFYYEKRTYDYGEEGVEYIYNRYDRAPNGAAAVYQLNPFTNEVDTIYLDGGGGYMIAYDEVFGNPFNKMSMDGFGAVIDGCVSLRDGSVINANYLFNVIFAGRQYNSPLTRFDISYDEEYNPLKLYIEFETVTEYYSLSDCYEASFVNPSTIDVEPIPEARPAQTGQDALQTMFDSLQDLNYTVEFESIVDQYDYQLDEETGEMIETKIGEVESTVKTYITPEGYFFEFGGELKEREESLHNGQFADHGEFETDKGFVEFQRDTDGSLHSTNLPKPIRNVESKFGGFWQYSARSFDVQQDGSFTLADVKGFELYLRSGLMTDGVVWSPAFVQNLKLELRNNGTELYYEYHDEQAVCKATIKNIGSTVLPVDTTAVTPFTAPTTWAEWAEGSDWNTRQLNALNIMTNNHPEAIPFIYTPYDYERSYDTDGETDVIFLDEPPYVQIVETITAVKYHRSIYQCDTCEEAVNAYNSAVAQATGGGFFTLDVTKDAYYHLEGDGEGAINLELKISIVQNYQTQLSDEGVFKYAVEVYVRNLNYAEQQPGVIEF